MKTAMPQSSSPRRLLNLPNELGICIAEYITSPLDRIAFVSSCKVAQSWMVMAHPHHPAKPIKHGLSTACHKGDCQHPPHPHDDSLSRCCNATVDRLITRILMISRRYPWLFREHTPGRCIVPGCGKDAQQAFSAQGTVHAMQKMVFCSKKCMQ